MNVQYSPWPVHRMNNLNMNIMEPLAELDAGFEPQTRARSNTWPLPRPENYVEPGEEGSNKCAGMDVSGGGGPVPTSVTTAKKNSSRRNAWGNLSYADLITQAITSAPDKRLTLSQIYEWMVQNVPYFKDKGDSNSSAGWKNSIRHNLSLHNRFMRVQNEGTGKSSWWMINPDAKPGKSVRRRAASMETSKFEKRRGRVKKKVEALRNGITADITPSPSSSISEGLDTFPSGSPLHGNTGFQLSPDFRPRTSSNTSSCGGRLSPIPAMLGVEPDWSSASPFPSSSYSPEMQGGSGNYSPDQLAGNLEQGMKLQPDYMGYIQNGHTPQQPPPPYSAPYEPFLDRRDLSSLHATSPYGLPQCPIHHRLQPCGCLQVQCKVESMSPSGMSPSYPTEPSPDPLSSQYIYNTRTSIQRPVSSSPPVTTHSGQGGHMPSTMMGQLMGTLNSPLLDEFNIDSLDAGIGCNVEEVLKHELSMEGGLEFANFPNFPNNGHQLMGPASELHSTVPHNPSVPEPPVYSTTATTPSWVH